MSYGKTAQPAFRDLYSKTVLNDDQTHLKSILIPVWKDIVQEKRSSVSLHWKPVARNYGLVAPLDNKEMEIFLIQEELAGTFRTPTLELVFSNQQGLHDWESLFSNHGEWLLQETVAFLAAETLRTGDLFGSRTALAFQTLECICQGKADQELCLAFLTKQDTFVF